MQIVCMKYQILYFLEKKKKNANVLPADFAQRVVKRN